MILWDLLFPNRCPFCRKLIDAKATVCHRCEQGLPYLPKPLCRIDMGEVKRLYCAVYYDGAVPDGIGEFKFRGKSQLAPYFADLMMKRMGEELRQEGCSCVCCVPMHRSKQRMRGYNQAELLAKELARRLGAAYRPCLVKVRSSKDQHTLTAEQRRTNLRNSYRACGVCEGTILLVDDVCTSGSTLKECAQTLRDGGASCVIAASIALTPNRQEREAAFFQTCESIHNTKEEPLKKNKK